VFSLRDIVWERTHRKPDAPSGVTSVWTESDYTLAEIDVNTGWLEPHITPRGSGAIRPTCAPRGDFVAYLSGEGSLVPIFDSKLKLTGWIGKERCQFTILDAVDSLRPSWAADMKSLYASRENAIVRVPVPRRVQEAARSRDY
jgi:hypothetical protein